MKKPRQIELRERARKLLGVQTAYDTEEMKHNFRRQMKLVNPHRPQIAGRGIAGHSNDEVASLLIQAYRLLVSGEGPTTMLEDDVLVGTMLSGDITPLSDTETDTSWSAHKFYDQFQQSIWPEPSAEDIEKAQHKFGRHKESKA